MLLAFLLFAQNLDAPVTQQPTVRSEIKNGFEAGEICAQYGTRAASMDPCFRRLATEYRMRNPSYHAFLVGLGVREWTEASVYIKAADQLPGNIIARDEAAHARIAGMAGERLVREGIGVLQISLEDAFTAAGVVPANRPPSLYTN